MISTRRRDKDDDAIALLVPVEVWHGKQTFAVWQAHVLWSTLPAEAPKLIHTPPPVRKLGPGE
jgi:hypothetical protein